MIECFNPENSRWNIAMLRLKQWLKWFPVSLCTLISSDLATDLAYWENWLECWECWLVSWEMTFMISEKLVGEVRKLYVKTWYSRQGKAVFPVHETMCMTCTMYITHCTFCISKTFHHNKVTTKFLSHFLYNSN